VNPPPFEAALTLPGRLFLGSVQSSIAEATGQSSPLDPPDLLKRDKPLESVAMAPTVGAHFLPVGESRVVLFF